MTTTHPPRPADALEDAARRAYRLPLPAVLGASAVLILVGLASVSQGAAGLPLEGVARSLVGALPWVDVPQTLTPQQESLLWQIRLPRTVLGGLVGASLAMAGAGYQGVFRNPLADPYLLGVSAGAGLGAVLALGFGLDLSWGPVGALPAAAFVGAVLAVTGSVVVARGSFRDPATLLLAGVAMAALFSATQTFALQKLDESRSREVLSWLFGRLATHGWQPVTLLLPYVLLAGVVLLLHARHLDVLRLGDDEARALGLHPARSRLVVVGAATLITAAAVSVSGLIAFVGLVTPHLVRLLVGHSYRVIVPLSGLVGAAFLALTDIGARTLAAPAELPVGIITAFVGAPFFCIVLWRGRHDA
ncbi:iron ABC transporter permease [Ornithinimicrobium humiphilum]|uniref:Iron complex transport system permease protein n=1 Tax=Ornithinimicrobium humiphilum TaxID=125288 RepID=A0A543K6W3_9MICO|nr:iron ABC transporter permease [Ornithinimicrobium humiphilum]TQM90810.1 iron complex transport system permease protein [Ornithinimicrobium humiphilum]